MYDGFQCHHLDTQHTFWTGRLPPALVQALSFGPLWCLHPDAFHEITMHGRRVKTPRWQQAYGADYQYSGNVHKALPIPASLIPILHWSQVDLYPGLNGLLLNWYDGQQGHYIGKHRDSTTNMVKGAPIITISLGETRQFRLRPWRGQGFVDFLSSHGGVFVMPYVTNQAWTHEVPAFKRYLGKRISITIRAFHTL